MIKISENNKFNSPQLQCDRISEEIEFKIKSGSIPCNSKLNGIRVFARQYGVSNKVIELALAQLAKKGLVEGQVGRGTFVKSNMSSVLPKQEQLLALVSYYASHNFEGYFQGFTEELMRKKIALLYGYYNSEISPEDQLNETLDNIVSRKPQTLLIDTSFIHDYKAITKKFIGTKTCLVHNELPYKEFNCNGVFTDYSKIYEQAYRYLLNKGHKKILLVGFDFQRDEFHAEPRLQPIAEALSRLDESLGSTVFPYLCYTDFSENPQLVDQVITVIEAPTAIIGMSDYITYLALESFKKRFPQLPVPEAIGIYDTMWSQVPSNEFHTFNLNFNKIWEKAISMLTSSSSERNITWIKPTFIERIKT